MQSNQDETIAANQTSGKGSALSLGTIVGDKYRVDSLIGIGGMGAVYRVKQIFLEKDFALKALDLHQRTEASARRFHLEARTASQLQHPNLVEVHDFGIFGDKQPYLVMDLVEGVTLSDLLKQKGSLSVDYVTKLCVQLCFGLLYAHGKGVVHRDIKPGNIMLLHPDRDYVTEGTVKIVDFGIAKLTQSEDGQIQKLTQTGEIFGSPVYMSPEQCKGTAVDKRSDIYSLGCVIFECLSGTPPFLGDSAMATMMMRLSDDIPSLKEASLGREFPEVLESIVRKMLAADPADRYQDLSVVINDLVAVQSPEQGLVVSATQKEKPKKKELSLGKKFLAVFLVALGASGATAIFDRVYVYPYYFLPTLNNSHASSVFPFGSGVNAGNLPERIKKLKAMQSVLLPDPLSVSVPKREGIIQAAMKLAVNPSVKEHSEAAAMKEPRRALISTEPAEVTEVRNKYSTMEFDDGFGTKLGIRSAKGVPKIVEQTSLPGAKREFLTFPDDYGSITFGNHKFRARGLVLLRRDQSIFFRLSAVAALNPNTLQNLTGLNFKRIEFPGNAATNDRTIAILKKIPALEEVGLECSDITKLSPFYNSTTLNKLDVAGTRVPTSEIMRVKRLHELKSLSFGPVPDPQIVFNALADSARLQSINYRGALGRSEIGKGLEPNQVDALSKMTHLKRLTIQVCPKFDNASLKKLLCLKELQEIKVTDCALTPECIGTLRQFKSLRVVHLPTKKWPADVVAALRREKFELYQIQSRKERNEEAREKVEHSAGIIGE